MPNKGPNGYKMKGMKLKICVGEEIETSPDLLRNEKKKKIFEKLII